MKMKKKAPAFIFTDCTGAKHLNSATKVAKTFKFTIMEKFIIKVPAYWLESPATLARLAAQMVERWKGSVKRNPDFQPFKMMLQVWRDIEGSPEYFINNGIVVSR